jgi:hypothetical protein
MVAGMENSHGGQFSNTGINEAKADGSDDVVPKEAGGTAVD